MILSGCHSDPPLINFYEGQLEPRSWLHHAKVLFCKVPMLLKSQFHWRIRGAGARDAPGGQILSFSCSFRKKVCKIQQLANKPIRVTRIIVKFSLNKALYLESTLCSLCSLSLCTELSRVISKMFIDMNYLNTFAPYHCKLNFTNLSHLYVYNSIFDRRVATKAVKLRLEL